MSASPAEPSWGLTVEPRPSLQRAVRPPLPPPWAPAPASVPMRPSLVATGPLHQPAPAVPSPIYLRTASFPSSRLPVTSSELPSLTVRELFPGSGGFLQAQSWLFV